jgi:hypothetical protein
VLPGGASGELDEKRYVTAILRLLMNRQGELLHGEVADVEGRPCKRFVDWQGLMPAVRAWLADIDHRGP